ncbi:hypothetical protein L4D77_17865 [Photobacterium frigidiphilum]|uniref:GapS4a family protein n=1 Tax=Photobacterium frigidiphilum TaxID=264736 RepID=UPI003D124EC1
MGEFSKTVGEQGENLVSKFLDTIGWVGAQSGESIDCCKSEAHKNPGTNGRKTHGIDFFYSTKSQLQDYTLDNVVMSVKYTDKPYPSNPSTLFKAHLKDLAYTIECYMKSDFRTDNNDEHSMSGIKQANDTGVLFWFTNDKDSDQDVVGKVSTIQLEKSLSFSSIYLVDNSRAAFIYNVIKYVRDNFSEYSFYYHYTFSSANYKGADNERYGIVFPVEYLVSNILPFRLINKDTKKNVFCLASREQFSEESINRLLYLASDISQDFTDEFIFLFPEYDPLHDNKVLMKAKRLVNAKNRAPNIKVLAYNNDFRGLVNE